MCRFRCMLLVSIVVLLLVSVLVIVKLLLLGCVLFSVGVSMLVRLCFFVVVCWCRLKVVVFGIIGCCDSVLVSGVF